ncbi:MAG: hypothetical protein EBQ89_07080 [Alphaproteobacteria bacterium]|nr:hypothetical protein [Alphaproteobacteria bacterium]
MQDHMDLGPVELSYAAAVRGHMPAPAGTSLTYALLGATDAEAGVALAASNPEGQFYFFCNIAADTTQFENISRNRGVTNCRAITASVTEFSSKILSGASAWPAFDYLCLDTTSLLLLPEELHQFMAATPRAISTRGLVALRYRPFNRLDDAFQYVVNTFADQVPETSHAEFMAELSALATRMSARNRVVGQMLADHAKTGDLKGLRGKLRPDVPTSKTLDVQQSMLKAGMHYLGDAKISDNYLEMAVPKAAQEQLMTLSKTPHFEVFKDLARDKLVRCDVWSRPEADYSITPEELFKRFSFGIAQTSAIPATLKVGEQELNLKAPPFARLVAMMSVMPITLADCVEDPEQAAAHPADIVSALQILVAAGIAAPMRACFAGGRVDSSSPKAANQFNLHALALNEAPTSSVPLLASVIIGRPVRMDAKDFLVLKSITQQSGMEGSAHVLKLLLEMVATDPLKALTLLGGRQPTTDLAASMINDVCQRDFANWYGYGLLAA